MMGLDNGRDDIIDKSSLSMQNLSVDEMNNDHNFFQLEVFVENLQIWTMDLFIKCISMNLKK